MNWLKQLLLYFVLVLTVQLQTIVAQENFDWHQEDSFEKRGSFTKRDRFAENIQSSSYKTIYYSTIKLYEYMLQNKFYLKTKVKNRARKISLVTKFHNYSYKIVMSPVNSY